MKIIVTGSDGFSGSNYCVKAKELGHQVLATDLKTWFRPEGCKIGKLDIRDYQNCLKICHSLLTSHVP